MINGKSFFNQLVKNGMNTFNNIQKTKTDQGDDYATGCQVDYYYSEKHYTLIAIDLSKK